MSRKSMSRSSSRSLSPRTVLRPLGVMLAALSVPAVYGQSVQFPTYTAGPQPDGSYVVGNGQVISPSGIQVDLGTQVRAKAVAVNPIGNHTAAVLTMGASAAVQVFNTKTGKVLQSYSTLGTDSQGSNLGITYTPDGKYLLFSQDSSFVAIAAVNPGTGLLSDYAHVSVPVAGTTVQVPLDGSSNQLSTVTCFPNSPNGTTGSSAIPCGDTVSYGTSYPTGIAISPDGKTAYVVLNVNNTLTKIDLTASKPLQGAEIRVGNIPHSVVVSADGKRAYVSNEAGRIATAKDFQGYSDGTNVVADSFTGALVKGTVSVVDLATFQVINSIDVGYHPTGMALWGNHLLVANAYSDDISVIDINSNAVVRTIDLGLPIGFAREHKSIYGAGPNSIAVDALHNIAYVALYNANAVAVVNLSKSDPDDSNDKFDYDSWYDDGTSAGRHHQVLGLIPVGYAPSSVAFDAKDYRLIVANDKGLGTKGIPPQNSFGTYHGVTGYNTHQDLGTVSIVAIPNREALIASTKQVIQNNHWDLVQNIRTASGGDPHAEPRALPRKIGDPSKIKHVFLIIRENRTYDQILGDVYGGNGDPSLAVYGSNATFGNVTPNAHELLKRFPLFDNFYNPSRQSADGHNWIFQAMAPYSDDIQSPDWVRDYPSNGGDSIAYQEKGFIWDQAARQHVSFKNYGEYLEANTFKTPTGSTVEPQWIDFYNDTLAYESGSEKQLYNYNTVASHTALPNLFKATVQNYPQFDLGIPDQFRVDIWQQDFAKDLAAGTVPQLEALWISSDHTGGPPTGQAMQADNDLAFGRFIDIISHSSIWDSSAIFVEEDDAQNGVDHVDGHRSPGYIISPYVNQNGLVDSTFYTQVNMTRTIEQILGLKPLNQFDLTASPMKTAFLNEPPAENFKPWVHVPNAIALNAGVSQTPTQTIPAPAVAKAQLVSAGGSTVKTSSADSVRVQTLRAGWMKKKATIFAGKLTKPDSEDTDTVNHLDWYEATNFIRPYPGEKKVRPATDFNHAAPAKGDNDD